MGIVSRAAALCAVVILWVASAAGAAELGTARLSLVAGDVQILTEDTNEWVPAAVNMPLAEGDRLWSPDGSRAEIQVRGGVQVRVDARTALDIVDLGRESFQLSLTEGRAYLTNRKGGVDRIRVDTPYASTGIYDNSIVMVDAVSAGTAVVAVIKGYAVVETRQGTTRVSAGSELRLTADELAEIAPIGSPDEWETWNRKRDRLLADAAESLRYVPDELDDYAADLDANGRWLYAREYGYVWSPRVSAAVDWAPYRLGRWTWVRGSYVWISYEPWGWAPYHYGRWVFVSRVGWCWVPPSRGAAYWGPGYVGWVYSSDTVAWVPLAPGEIYYGIGFYGPFSVDITNVAVNPVVVRTYRHIHVRNAVTVIDRDTFITGRRGRSIARENPFISARVEVGPPAIRPARETRRPIDKRIAPERQPPERIRKLKPEEVRRDRRTVPGDAGSVFSPGRQADEMRVKRRETPRRQEAAPAPSSGRQGGKGAGPPAGRERLPEGKGHNAPAPPAPRAVPGKEPSPRPRPDDAVRQPRVQQRLPQVKTPAPDTRKQVPEAKKQVPEMRRQAPAPEKQAPQVAPAPPGSAGNQGREVSDRPAPRPEQAREPERQRPASERRDEGQGKDRKKYGKDDRE